MTQHLSTDSSVRLALAWGYSGAPSSSQLECPGHNQDPWKFESPTPAIHNPAVIMWLSPEGDWWLCKDT